LERLQPQSVVLNNRHPGGEPQISSSSRTAAIVGVCNSKQAKNADF